MPFTDENIQAFGVALAAHASALGPFERAVRSETASLRERGIVVNDDLCEAAGVTVVTANSLLEAWTALVAEDGR